MTEEALHLHQPFSVGFRSRVDHGAQTKVEAHQRLPSPTEYMVFTQRVWLIVQYLRAVWHVVWIRFCRWLLKYRSLKPASRYTCL